MSTFIFALNPGTPNSVIFRMLTELEEAFPQHDFVAGDTRFEVSDQAILAILENDDAQQPKTTEFAEVSAFFRATLKELEGWKPS